MATITYPTEAHHEALMVALGALAKQANNLVDALDQVTIDPANKRARELRQDARRLANKCQIIRDAELTSCFFPDM